MKLSRGDRTLHVVIYILLTILGFLTLYPFWNSAVISFNLGLDTAKGGITFWPREFTLDNYKIVLEDDRIVKAFGISVLRTIAGTFLSILFTALFAYGMSIKGVVFKKFYMVFAIITMYFSGGLIPSFLVNVELGLMDTFWVLVIPTIISVYNMIIFRTFFQGLPAGLEESARIDGASTFGVFFRIVLPLSGPVIATLSLFTAVYHWNDWFTATIYISDNNLFPIQTMLQQAMNSNLMTEQLSMATQGNAAAADAMSRMQSVTTKSLTMATMMVATIPIILVYPFVQRFFVKGVLVGSLKE
ncbi:carbohydrate ABC transporter permease [Paenibacillus soyae]|uniref:Carbohydrate ABC transporter permease n=1 Tax=Paenibacillus soyae TaxID=2969249 RepID=A0A9X2MVV5_9BACL|nr:carbohydrate ABC transporter permease [Paenibacillus soyae]MCR2804582.1 carbohydrate ABC transporter permease [Paenibacillus soyae]